MQAKVCASYYLSPVPSTKVSNQKKKKPLWSQISGFKCQPDYVLDTFVSSGHSTLCVYFRNMLYLKGVF